MKYNIIVEYLRPTIIANAPIFRLTFLSRFAQEFQIVEVESQSQKSTRSSATPLRLWVTGVRSVRPITTTSSVTCAPATPTTRPAVVPWRAGASGCPRRARTPRSSAAPSNCSRWRDWERMSTCACATSRGRKRVFGSERWVAGRRNNVVGRATKKARYF